MHVDERVDDRHERAQRHGPPGEQCHQRVLGGDTDTGPERGGERDRADAERVADADESAEAAKESNGRRASDLSAPISSGRPCAGREACQVAYSAIANPSWAAPLAAPGRCAADRSPPPQRAGGVRAAAPAGLARVPTLAGHRPHRARRARRCAVSRSGACRPARTVGAVNAHIRTTHARGGDARGASRRPQAGSAGGSVGVAVVAGSDDEVNCPATRGRGVSAEPVEVRHHIGEDGDGEVRGSVVATPR